MQLAANKRVIAYKILGIPFHRNNPLRSGLIDSAFFTHRLFIPGIMFYFYFKLKFNFSHQKLKCIKNLGSDLTANKDSFNIIIFQLPPLKPHPDIKYSVFLPDLGSGPFNSPSIKKILLFLI